MAETAETPEIWVFVVTGCTRQAATPEKTKAVQDLILEESGVLVQNYLSAHGSSLNRKIEPVDRLRHPAPRPL